MCIRDRLYTDSIVKAYKMFSMDESFEGITNVYDLNRHPNETMVVDDALYHAFAVSYTHLYIRCRMVWIKDFHFPCIYLCSDQPFRWCCCRIYLGIFKESGCFYAGGI